jgi:hypothetical protein
MAAESRFKFSALFTIQGQNVDPSIVAVFTDGEYTVAKHDHDSGPFEFRLSIKRLDGARFHDWRLFQDIKNDVAGADRVAIEIYPAEDEVTDTANIYHLWVFHEGIAPLVKLTPPT